jgi:hypothetical protein
MSESKPPVRPEESLAKMVAALKDKTGKSLEEWKEVIAKAGWQAHREIVNSLKSLHGVSHGYANQIALRALESDEPDSDPFDEVFAKRPEAEPIYSALVSKMASFGGDINLAAKKGYVSVRRSKQFAIFQPAAGRLDVGLVLKGVEPSGRLEASGSFNAMVTHRVKVAGVDEIDATLVGWLRQAYEAVG